MLFHIDIFCWRREILHILILIAELFSEQPIYRRK